MHRSLLLLMTFTVLVLGACDDDAGMVQDSIVGEGIPLDLTRYDVDDGSSTADSDHGGTLSSLKIGEIVSGAATSKGGAYSLFSHVGHWSEPKEMKGKKYALRWNAAIIQW